LKRIELFLQMTSKVSAVKFIDLKNS